MATGTARLISAGPLADLERQGCVVVTGAGHTIAVFHHGGRSTPWTTGARTWAFR